MKNYKSTGRSSVVGEIPEQMFYVKAKDMLGHYDKGDLQVLGFLKTKSQLYNRDQYCLFIKYNTDKAFPAIMNERLKAGVNHPYIFLNVPEWYGKRLEEDFQSEEVAAEEFFKDAFIEIIEELTTNKNSNTIDILIYED
jgi:hypothetical protein